jgi:hypothetical protein
MKRAGSGHLMKVRCTWSLMFAILLTPGCTDTQNVNAKLNPQRVPYEITITIDGALGPFDSATASVKCAKRTIRYQSDPANAQKPYGHRAADDG